ncbi:MAG: ribonuclease Y [Opitutales bacterium]|nr:ribonuclease Y [Opitutales bacterium]MCH8540633.1 ribonuclease Y [Opitutales bacterium]
MNGLSFFSGLSLGLLVGAGIVVVFWYLWKTQKETIWQRELQLIKHKEEKRGRSIKEEADALIAEKEKSWVNIRAEQEKEKQEIATMQERLGREKEQIAIKRKEVEQEKVDVLQSLKDAREHLEKLSHISSEEAKSLLLEVVEKETSTELRALRRSLLEKPQAAIREEAREKLLTAMQRLASQPLNDVTATMVQLPNEEMKGRIIGKEGRNIKSFESNTGVTLMIDESPQSVLISSFDPIRREVARIALENLVADGRIHPALIEEQIQKAEQQVQEDVSNFGLEAADQLKLSGLHPDLIELIGKLKYRFSFTQNALDHSIEVAFLSSMLASELGLDPLPAKRAGLFHDIGKAMEHQSERSHALAAADFLRRHNEDERVVNAVAAHHEEVPSESLYAPILMIADGLSASRPGARVESQITYLERLENLENLARQHEEVEEAYAIQGGREVRVIVNPKRVSDEISEQLASKIRQEIEDNLNYPGSIKITLIREKRVTEIAK